MENGWRVRLWPATERIIDVIRAIEKLIEKQGGKK